MAVAISVATRASKDPNFVTDGPYDVEGLISRFVIEEHGHLRSLNKLVMDVIRVLFPDPASP